MPNELTPNTTPDPDPRDLQILHLANEIREMDTEIFQASQCLDWPTMRPWIAKLVARMERRRKAESNRINELLQTELLKIYTKP